METRSPPNTLEEGHLPPFPSLPGLCPPKGLAQEHIPKSPQQVMGSHSCPQACLLEGSPITTVALTFGSHT